MLLLRVHPHFPLPPAILQHTRTSTSPNLAIFVINMSTATTEYAQHLPALSFPPPASLPASIARLVSAASLAQVATGIIAVLVGAAYWYMRPPPEISHIPSVSIPKFVWYRVRGKFSAHAIFYMIFSQIYT